MLGGGAVISQFDEDARTEAGASLIGVLLTVVILGGLALIAILATNSETSVPSLPSVGGSTTLTSGTGGVQTDISSAAVVACQTNYVAVSQALQTYEALNGHAPANIGDLQTELRDKISSPYYTFGLDSQGAITVATAAHRAAPGDGNCLYAG